jgi:hypothetical protein
MSDSSFSPALNLPKRYVKGLHKSFGGLMAPWYIPNTVCVEGQPMKFGTAQDTMDVCGDTDGAKCVGLAAQIAYDESAFAELKGYQFLNNTKQRLDGSPIGLLTGQGYAFTNCYVGTVAWGNKAYIDPTTKKLTAASSTSNGLPIVFEGAGTNGAKLVRIRFNFVIA